jgi:hypothetical protein
VTEPEAWLASYAARSGLSYEPDADERWLRAWEPFATLRAPIRYEHALLATGRTGSITVARMVVEGAPRPDGSIGEASAWIAIAQDERLGGDARLAATSDFVANRSGVVRPGIFGDSLDLVAMPRRRSGDVTFDAAFAAFAPTPEDLARALTPSLRKLVLGWRLPIHFEVRAGGFVLAPTSLGPDPQSLTWLLGAVQFFGEKAAKRVHV